MTIPKKTFILILFPKYSQLGFCARYNARALPATSRAGLFIEMTRLLREILSTSPNRNFIECASKNAYELLSATIGEYL